MAVDPPPPPPPKKFKGEKGKKGRKGDGKGRKGGSQTKGADKRQDAQWANWNDSSWHGAGAWWSGSDSNHDCSTGSGGRGQTQKQGGKRHGQWRPFLRQTPAPQH